MSIEIAQSLIRQKKFKNAKDHLEKLIKTNEENINIYFFLGIANFELGNYEESISNYDKCLKIDAKSINVLLNLATVKESYGEINEAKDIYQKIISINDNVVRAYYGLLNLSKDFLSQTHYKKIEKINKNNITLFEKSLCHFILSKNEKEKKNFKDEFIHLEHFHDNCFKSNLTFNKTSQYYYKKIISNFYNKIIIKNIDKEKNSTKNIFPIFIVGLPRSGSTLVEAILTSNEDNILTFGENHSINMSILDQIGKKIFNKDFKIEKFNFEIDFNLLKKTIIERYSQFKSLDNSNIVLIDKSLENFYNLELIFKLFPNAKVLHCYRNNIDAVISIYSSMLFELSWSHKIEDILDYMDNYLKVINFFKKKYPNKIMDINLEDLTISQDKLTQKIYNFCNLKWSKKSLEFYKRKNLKIRTLSNSQLRKKISKYNKKKYKDYFRFIEQYEKHYNWLK